MTRPRSSWLFVPGDSPRKIQKAIESDADVVILDLEDSVQTANKSLARVTVAQVLASTDAAARCFVRVNAKSFGQSSRDAKERLYEDLSVAQAAAGVVLPKCEGPKDVVDLASCIRSRMEIVAIVTETARGVQCLSDFREPIPGLCALMWGAEDLCADLFGKANRDEGGGYFGPYAHARDATLVAARAVGASAIDAVYTEFRDLVGLERECVSHRRLGFDAKAAIHPEQLPVIHKAYMATGEELIWAKRVLDAVKDGQGVAQLDGRMIDAPHVRQARQVLGHRAGQSPELTGSEQP